MSEHVTTPENSRIYEGPAELYVGEGVRGDQYTERLANDGTKFFTNAYGERGFGWDFDPSTHAGQNNFIKFGNDFGRELARQALRNNELFDLQVTDEGEPVTDHQIDTMTRTDPAPRGSLIIYPDGKRHFAEKFLSQ
ncbi:MAG: hypothetical protein ABIR37_00560 [Candidatus Saccharimonadales bacterium]